MARLVLPAAGPSWLKAFADSIVRAFKLPMDAPLRLQSFAKADLPDDPLHTGGLVYITNEAGGPTIAFYDGTDWRRVQDRAVVS